MRTALTATIAALSLTVSIAPPVHAYTTGAAPVLTDFTCNGDGTVTFVWDKNAGKPAELLLSRTSNPPAGVVDRIPGSRGAKGSYTYSAPSYAQSGAALEGRLRTRSGVLGNTLSATCA